MKKEGEWPKFLEFGHWGFGFYAIQVMLQVLLLIWLTLKRIGFIRCYFMKYPEIEKKWSLIIMESTKRWIERERDNWSDLQILQERYDNLKGNEEEDVLEAMK